MELARNSIMVFIEAGGFFAPLLFISIHLFRPLLFLPVIFICISGGVLFGAIAGTLYSIIGITLSSMIFYAIIYWTPKTLQKLSRLKQRLLGKNTEVTTSQITLLRLIPFIHFHLLSLCLLEISTSFKEYMKLSIVSSIPFALIYTFIGNWISSLSPAYIMLFILALIPLIYTIRKKQSYIKWRDFFQVST